MYVTVFLVYILTTRDIRWFQFSISYEFFKSIYYYNTNRIIHIFERFWFLLTFRYLYLIIIDIHYAIWVLLNLDPYTNSWYIVVRLRISDFITGFSVIDCCIITSAYMYLPT